MLIPNFRHFFPRNENFMNNRNEKLCCYMLHSIHINIKCIYGHLVISIILYSFNTCLWIY